MVFQRLPTSVVPVNYNLCLQPDLEKLVFSGSEEIEVEVKEATTKIILNAREIQVSNAIFSGGDVEISPEIEYDTPEEKILFDLKKSVQTGTYILKFKFTGILNDELRGFYRTKYMTPEKEERNGALTHFEATGARRAFPCFDEPAIRATFDITLIVPKDRIALSNMPVQSEQEITGEGGRALREVKFNRTPIMSTYLVAFVVGEFDYTRCVDEDGVEIRVYVPRKKGRQGLFAAQVALETIPFYKKYFNVAYNLPKLDLVAAPDFPIGAMENWGLVIYREGALLVDLEKSSSFTKEYVALIVGHELAHNWFGNLVTLNWWTHLWLKEGFASWIEYLCVDHCFPEYDVWTQFVSIDLGRALKLDALENSHPIEVEVGNPAEVDEIFDAISYCKGASIIRMLHDYIGDVDFRKGMEVYLKRHQFGSACTEDLWRALEEASGKPVSSVMSTWTAQKGFPVLKVTEKQSGNQRILEITQRKFSASLSGQSADDSLWIVPISITSESNPSQPIEKIVMKERSMTVTLEVPEGKWIKVNANSTGVYRVQYSSDMLKKFIPSIQNKTLPPADRLGIVSDLFALCEIGLVSAADLFAVVKAFTTESNFTVWSDLLSNLSELSRVLQGTEASSNFKTYACDLLRVVYADVGWEKKRSEEENQLRTMLRELVVTVLGTSGKQEVHALAKAAFESHISEQKPIPNDLRQPVYKTIMLMGDRAHYDKLKEMYTATDSPEEKSLIGSAFGYSPDLTILKDVLNFALSKAVRPQDSPSIISRVSIASIQGRELAWTFFKDNYEELYQRYSSSTLLARLVKMTTQDFATEEKAVEIEEFFKKHAAPSAERTVQQSCERIRLNVQWLKREAENISKVLQDNLPSSAEVASEAGEGDQVLHLKNASKGKISDKISIVETGI